MIPNVSERDFQSAVIDAARLYGWRVAHFRSARTETGWATPVQADGAGFPDLVLVHPQRCRVLYRELKSEAGRVRPAQAEWGAWLTAAGCDWMVWRPSDFAAILQTLSGLDLET